MTPPPNPHESEYRAAYRAAMQAAGWTQLPLSEAVTPPAPRKALPLYPLTVALPVWVHTCNDAGVTIWIDDPQSM